MPVWSSVSTVCGLESFPLRFWCRGELQGNLEIHPGHHPHVGRPLSLPAFMNFPIRFRCADYKPAAFMWTPPSIKTERLLDVPGCECLGTMLAAKKFVDGVEEIGGGNALELSHAIPCVCLHMTIEDLAHHKVIQKELDAHFREVVETGKPCECLFCEQRKKVLGSTRWKA
jgi:hypothetical protein